MRHAPALATAVLAWLLMVPPGRMPPHQAHRNKRAALVPDPGAPLNGWYPVEKFSTEILCRDALSDLSTTTSHGREALLLRYHDPRERRFMAKAITMGQCVSGDDPRVKGVR